MLSVVPESSFIGQDGGQKPWFITYPLTIDIAGDWNIGSDVNYLYDSLGTGHGVWRITFDTNSGP
jgi:hypothetical protein